MALDSDPKYSYNDLVNGSNSIIEHFNEMIDFQMKIYDLNLSKNYNP